jgi:3-keto-disaccharide hydrolase
MARRCSTLALVLTVMLAAPLTWPLWIGSLPVAAQSTTSVAATPAANVLYAADWSQGPNGWNYLPAGWSIAGGMLAVDASGSGVVVIAPYLPPRADYAVEVEMQLRPQNGTDASAFWGIMVRELEGEGYLCGGVGPDGGSPNIGYGVASSQIATADGTFDTDWHTYRVEVRGEAIRFFRDGELLVAATDNTFPEPGEIALLAKQTPLTVRSFKVLAL